MIPSEEILSGQTIASKCDYVFSQASEKNGNPFCYIADQFPRLLGGEVIFCKTDFLDLLNQCVRLYVPEDVPFSIVTHDSDYPLDDDRINRFGNRPISWWGMNCESSKGTGIPIGIANSYSKLNLRAFETSNKPSKLLYVNNRIETAPHIRKPIYDHFSSFEWATVRIPYEHPTVDPRYMTELIDHKFVLCPRGNGVDTHRMWEALYCGVVPVVQRHRTYSMIEGQLPILFIDDFREVTESLLENAYESFADKSNWNMNALTVSWWINQIRNQNI